MHERLFNQFELADAMGISRHTIEKWCRRGLPGYYQRGKAKRPVYSVSRTREWIESQDWIRVKLRDPEVKED